MVSHSLPKVSKLVEAKQLCVQDVDGNLISFGTLLDQQGVNVKRTLVVFIRHFFCGNCQEYVRRLGSELGPFVLPKDLSIIVVGCGAASLIQSYKDVTESPFPIYADPSTQLYKILGMQRSLSLGSKDPTYIQHSLAAGVVKSIVQGLKRIPSGDVGKAGDLSVNGGEFLLTRNELSSEWSISWSHCMVNSRDHTEIDVLKVQLGTSTSELTTEALVLHNASEPATMFDPAPSVKALDCKVCSDGPDAMRRSMSIKRRSWMAKAGQLTRSSSLRRSIIHLS